MGAGNEPVSDSVLAEAGLLPNTLRMKFHADNTSLVGTIEISFIDQPNKFLVRCSAT